MNDFFSYAEVGERFDQYALPWDKIEATSYKKLTGLNITQLKTEVEKQIAESPSYKLLQQSAEWKEALDKEETITLNQAKFNELMKTRKAQIEKFKGLDKFNN